MAYYNAVSPMREIDAQASFEGGLRQDSCRFQDVWDDQCAVSHSFWSALSVVLVSTADGHNQSCLMHTRAMPCPKIGFLSNYTPSFQPNRWKHKI
jgi:hypothetical protein